MGNAQRSDRGFALVLVVVLLGLLVLVTYALAAMGRIEAQAAVAAQHRLQARQNVLTALGLAVGALQRHADYDGCATAMAGVTGIPAGARQPTRHLTGVWQPGRPTAWLASGGDSILSVELTDQNSVLLMGPGTLGADGTEKEHVRAPWVGVEHGGARGRLAWWVGDEGVKLSLVAPDVPAFEHHALDEFFPRLDPASPELLRLQAYGQLVFVADGAVSKTQLQGHTHVVGLGHRSIAAPAAGSQWRVGRLNLNSSSARYWRGVAATYNRASPAEERLGVSAETFGERMSRGFAAAVGPGKPQDGPFLDVEAFLGSALLGEALRGSGVSAAQFGDRMRSRLTTRSDTFTVRAYGAAHSPAEAGVVAAEAWCEATVQRTAEELPGLGRRFVVQSFRWLGPEDL